MNNRMNKIIKKRTRIFLKALSNYVRAKNDLAKIIFAKVAFHQLDKIGEISDLDHAVLCWLHHELLMEILATFNIYNWKRKV